MIAAPFLRYAGGKRQLLAPIRRASPSSYSTYFEPFVGGGALFFNLQPHRAVLGDAAPALIARYETVRENPQGVITHLRHLEISINACAPRCIGKNGPHSRPSEDEWLRARLFYEEVRSRQFLVGERAKRAAEFIFCNRTSHNGSGAYRVNRTGRYNGPLAKDWRPGKVVCDVDIICAASRALASAVLLTGDFTTILADAKADDYAYFDSPYADDSAVGGPKSFTQYTAAGFTDHDHIRVRDLARELGARGVYVLLSNASVPLIQELYAGPDFTICEVLAKRSISADGTRRDPVTEVLITAGPAHALRARAVAVQ